MEDKNLTVSPEEATELIRKWFVDDLPVSLLILGPGYTASIAGFVSSMENGSFGITHLTDDGGVTASATFDVDAATDWNYKDLREASESARAFLQGRVASALSFHTRSCEFTIYEMNERE